MFLPNMYTDTGLTTTTMGNHGDVQSQNDWLDTVKENWLYIMFFVIIGLFCCVFCLLGLIIWKLRKQRRKSTSVAKMDRANSVSAEFELGQMNIPDASQVNVNIVQGHSDIIQEVNNRRDTPSDGSFVASPDGPARMIKQLSASEDNDFYATPRQSRVEGDVKTGLYSPGKDECGTPNSPPLIAIPQDNEDHPFGMIITQDSSTTTITTMDLNTSQ